jgi:predicted flap endonuclease-1-like 5' DNA nuclease
VITCIIDKEEIMVRKHRFLIGLIAISLVLMAFSYPAQIDQERRGIPWWVWVILFLLLAILIGWLLGLGSKEKEAEGPAAEEPHAVRVPASPVEFEPPPPAAVEAAPAAVEAAPAAVEAAPTAVKTAPAAEEAEPPPPDDLKRIEGIGPKISGLFREAGITTFAQLADTEVSWLKQIVLDAGIRIADPTTWPDQARLAAAGRWDELETLQDELKGGRRV